MANNGTVKKVLVEYVWEGEGSLYYVYGLTREQIEQIGKDYQEGDESNEMGFDTYMEKRGVVFERIPVPDVIING